MPTGSGKYDGKGRSSKKQATTPKKSRQPRAIKSEAKSERSAARGGPKAKSGTTTLRSE